jgi:hypothetical protein
MNQQNDRANQRSRLLGLLRSQSPGWVPISEVVSIAGFQYGTRILELRRLGHQIENDPGRAFRLITFQSAAAKQTTQLPERRDEPNRLFPDDAPERNLDLG